MSEDNNSRLRPVVLVILSGWGVAPKSQANAISLAKTPNFDRLVKIYPAMTIEAAGESIGLSKNEPGNSQWGCLNLGAGKVVYNNLSRINKAVESGSFFDNSVILNTLNQAKKNRKSLHLIGLLSAVEINSSINHLFALLESCRQQNLDRVFIHLILDGRDSDYNSGLELVERLEQKIEEHGVGKIASISGRFYAMDRDFNWQRTALTYKAMAQGEAEHKFKTATEAIKFSYDQEIYDEEFVPAVIAIRGKAVGSMSEGDNLLFFNFRADGMRQLVKALILPGFVKFPRPYYNFMATSLVEYDEHLPISAAFPCQTIDEPLSQVIADQQLSQVQISETEKYANITVYFNGEKEDIIGLKKVMVNSRRRISPLMASNVITKQALKHISSQSFDFMVLNYANIDIISHQGDIKGTIKACQKIDSQIKHLSEAVLINDGVMLITSDHASAEDMLNLQSGQNNQANTINPVPLIIVGRDWEGKTAGLSEVPGGDLSLIKPVGGLADVAPTILKIMDIKKPESMTGRSLI